MYFPKNNHRPYLWLLLLPLIWFLLADDDDNYFPLSDGYLWQYDVTIRPQFSPIENYKSIRVSLPSVTLTLTLTMGHEKTITATPIHHDNGLIYYYAHTDDDAIIRVGVQNHPSGAFQPQQPQRIIFPKSLAIDSQWQVMDTTYIIIREKPFYNENIKLILPIFYEVVAMDETIHVAAGKFDHCLHIIGRGTTSFTTSRGAGRAQVEVISEEWYAPNIGLIKTKRTEKTSSELYGTNHFTSELEHIRRPF